MNKDAIYKMKDEVLKKIESGQVSMKPKSFFYFKVILLFLLIFIGLVVSSVLISYILYSIKISGQLNLFSFGTRGIYEFILIFPWLVLILDIFVLMFVDWLIKSFRLGYNSPIIYLFLGTFMLMTLLGSLVNLTSFNRALMYKAETQNLPLVNNYYGSIRRSHSSRGIYRGVVESVKGNTFVLLHTDYDGDSSYGPIVIEISEELSQKSLIKVGDEVFVAGNVSTTSQVKAYGISKIVKLD
ncbi:MAG: hypothetical protein WAX44_00230 [Minisyncoccia bacterium]